MKGKPEKLNWVKKDNSQVANGEERSVAEEKSNEESKESDEWEDVDGGEQEPKTPVESEEDEEE